MDRATRPTTVSFNDNSLNHSSPFSSQPHQSLLSPSRGRHHPTPNNPSFCDFDPTLEAAFSGLRVYSAPDAEIDSPIGGYGFGLLSRKREQSSNIELLMRLRLLENNYAAAATLGHVGLPESRSSPMDSFVTSPALHQAAAAATLSNSRLRRQSRVSGELPANQRQNRNGFSHDRVGDCAGVADGSILAKSGLYNRQRDWVQSQEQPLSELSVEDLRGMIVALSKDQNGCRVLQKLIEGMKEEDIGMIFSEVIDHVGSLMIDPFGNYVVQKLVEVGSEEQRNQILLMVTQTEFLFVSICLNMHGTRAVQKLLEHLTTQEQISLVMAALSPGAVALTKDMNGHHVIQHCLKNFSDEDNKYLLNEVADNCFGIATDKSGCCVLQQCVEYSRGEPRERLISEILANALLLAEDRYGNYVVQHLLGLRVHQITANLLRKLEGRYLSLSCNKYGSNVVEKCLIESGEDRSTYIIMELLRNPNVSMLLLDPFGNFVIQSALTVSKGFVRNGVVHNALLDLIRMNYQIMRSNLYGKKILSWFDRRKVQLM